MIACKGPAAPDVSNIKIELHTKRFEKDFFAMDSTNIDAGIAKLMQDYPRFAPNFFSTILNVDPRWGGDTASAYVRSFLTAYRPVYDTSLKVFDNFSAEEKEITYTLQLVKYYFPSYAVPNTLITYIGPIDGYGDILDENTAIVGLHHHLGSSYSLYHSSYTLETYPAYISQRFVPATIPVNLAKNILLDMYPDPSDEKSLVVQMVESGKKLFVLQKLLPNVNEYLLIGYTEKQLKECYERERIIWDLFIHGSLLQSTDYNVNKNYVGEGPKTMELGEASPGNIGSFAGWQIVKEYMKKNAETTPRQLMETNAEEIFRMAKYKP
jgi:hypothetical protein